MPPVRTGAGTAARAALQRPVSTWAERLASHSKSVNSKPSFGAAYQDPSGAAARAALQRPVATWAERLASGRGPDFAPLHSPLSAREVALTLGLPRPLFASAAPWLQGVCAWCERRAA